MGDVRHGEQFLRGTEVILPASHRPAKLLLSKPVVANPTVQLRRSVTLVAQRRRTSFQPRRGGMSEATILAHKNV